MTFLELVNSVLRRLREDEVSSVSQTEYSTLISDFVNQAKREVEDAWNWTALRFTIQVNTITDVFRYTLTDVKIRSRLLVDPITNRPDVFNLTTQIWMQRAPSDQWMNQRFFIGATQHGPPIYFDLNGFDAAGDAIVDLWPVPTGVETINFSFIIPQQDFTLGTEVLAVPHFPVLLRAYALAVSERGEDQGNISNEVDRQADLALGDAIVFDVGRAPEEMIWRPV